MNLQEFADLIGVHYHTARKMIREGFVKMTVKTETVYELTDIGKKFMKAHEQTQPHESVMKVHETPDKVMIDEGQIIRKPQTNQQEVMKDHMDPKMRKAVELMKQRIQSSSAPIQSKPVSDRPLSQLQSSATVSPDEYEEEDITQKPLQHWTDQDFMSYPASERQRLLRKLGVKTDYDCATLTEAWNNGWFDSIRSFFAQ